MIPKALRAALLLPLFGYLLWLIAGAIASAGALAEAVFGLLLATNLAYLLPKRGARVAALAVGGILGVGLLSLLPLANLSIVPTSLGALDPVLLGFFLAGPFLIVAPLVLADESPGGLLLGYQFAVLDALLLVGAVEALAASAAPISASGIANAYGTEIGQQFLAWGKLLEGVNPGSFPLQAIGTPILIGLAAIGLLGVLLPALEPPEGARRPGPTGAGPMPRAPARTRLSPMMEAIVKSASPATAPPPRIPPGLGALVVGGIVLGVLLEVVVFAPSWSLVAVVGVGEGIVIGAWVAARRSYRVRARPVPAPLPTAAPSGGALPR